MVAWINRAVFQLARNGTTTHTVDPTSATGLVSGATFTPTTGSRLVVVFEAPVTSTTPSGWTLPSGGSAINNTGLYVWHRVAAAGSNSFTTTHNSSNYPGVVAFYEFPAGSTFVGSVAGTAIAYANANPNLTSLTGTNLVVGAVGVALASGLTSHATAWSGTGTPVEDVDVAAVFSTTDGYMFSLAYVEAFAGSSWQPTGAVTGSGSPLNKEALTFAVNVAASTVTVNAVPATVTATAPVPVVSGGATVAAVTASVSSAALVPTVSAGAVVTAVVATVTVTAGTPTVTGGGSTGPTFVQALTPNSNKTSGTNNLYVRTPAGGITAGNTIVVAIATNNSATGSPSVSSIDKPVGETASWVAMGAPSSPTGTSAAGVRTSSWAIQTTVAWPGATDYAVTLSGAVSSKAIVGAEFSGLSATRRGSGTTNGSTTGVLSATHSSPNLASGDIIFAASGWEDVAAGPDDTDTTDGTWATGLTEATTGSTADTNMAVKLQWKILTGASSQTWDSTGASTDASVAVYALTPSTPSSTVNAVVTNVSVTAPAPVVSAGATVTAVLATVTVTAGIPTVTGATAATVNAVTATVTATALAPTVTTGATITAVAAQFTVTAIAPTPVAGGGAVVAAVRAQVTATAPAPTVTGAATVTAVTANVTSTALAPTVTAGSAGTVTATRATVTVTAHAPTRVGVVAQSTVYLGAVPVTLTLGGVPITLGI